MKFKEPFNPEVFAQAEEKMKRKKLARLQTLATGRMLTLPVRWRPRSGQIRIAVGETHGRRWKNGATPCGVEWVLLLHRGFTPTAIHLLSLRDNRGYIQDANKDG